MSVFSKSRLFPHPVRGCATARRLWRLKKASFRSDRCPRNSSIVTGGHRSAAASRVECRRAGGVGRRTPQASEAGDAGQRRLDAFFWLIDGSGPNPSPYGNYLIHAHGLAASDGWLIVSIDNLVARVDHVMIRPQGRSRRGPQMSATPRQHVHQSRATHSRSATSACRVQSRA